MDETLTILEAVLLAGQLLDEVAAAVEKGCEFDASLRGSLHRAQGFAPGEGQDHLAVNRIGLGANALTAGVVSNPRWIDHRQGHPGFVQRLQEASLVSPRGFEDHKRVLAVAYADSAYQGGAIDAVLTARNVRARINEKSTRWHPLSEGQRAANREKSKTRCRVEHVFAQMTGSMKALYQRCIGLERNAGCLKLTNLVYNLLRFEQIMRLRLNLTA